MRHSLRGRPQLVSERPHYTRLRSVNAGIIHVAGTIQLSGLFNNNIKQAFLLGVPKLKLKNLLTTFGWVLIKQNISVTLDYYDITIKDR
jgi:hypothetical protein